MYSLLACSGNDIEGTRLHVMSPSWSWLKTAVGHNYLAGCLSWRSRQCFQTKCSQTMYTAFLFVRSRSRNACYEPRLVVIACSVLLQLLSWVFSLRSRQCIPNECIQLFCHNSGARPVCAGHEWWRGGAGIEAAPLRTYLLPSCQVQAWLLAAQNKL